MPRRSLLILVACGGGSSPPASQPSSAVAPAITPADIPTTWDDLLAQAKWIVAGRTEQNTKPSGLNELCITPSNIARGPALGRTCTEMHDITSMGVDSQAYPAPGEVGWLVFDRNKAVIAITRDSCKDGCAEPPKEQLLENLRCSRLTLLWTNLPPADVACTADADCMRLSSMCFESSVRADRAAPYQAIVSRWGGHCLHPGGGACPRFEVKAVCRERRCGIAQ